MTQLVGVGVSADLPAVQASEKVCARGSVAIECGEELVPGSAFLESCGLADRIDCSGLDGTQFVRTHRAQERPRIAAVRKPAFLLPAIEAGRAMRDLLNDPDGNTACADQPASDRGGIDELGLEPLMSGSVGDAPWADRLLVEFFF